MRTVGKTRVGESERKSRGTNHEKSGSYPGPAVFGAFYTHAKDFRLALQEMESPCDSEVETLYFRAFCLLQHPAEGPWSAPGTGKHRPWSLSLLSYRS